MARAQNSALQLLDSAKRSIDELLSSLGEPLDLTDFDILCALRTKQLCPEELATLSETQLPELLRAIRRLVAENLVRVKAGEVSLTARGERIRARTAPLVEQVERNLLAVLPSARRESFASDLNCIVQKLGSTPRTPKPR
jgi:DNA-binding MarR family transcriptional regulator